jgi:WXG100 family type VII secretion target
MGINVQLNYEELRLAVKKFRDEGEDIVQLHSGMRDRVRDLHKDWVGEGADKFFKEMENELLPGLVRLSGALFYAQDVLHKIMETIQTFDEDTAGYFKIDIAQINPVNLGAFLAGAGLGTALGGMASGPLPGGLPGAMGPGVGSPTGAESAGAGPADSLGEPGAPIPGDQTDLGQVGSLGQTPGAGGQYSGVDAGQYSGASTPGVGGAAGGGSAGTLGGAAAGPDHIYDGVSGGGAAGGSAQTLQPAGSTDGGAQGSTGGEEAVAAGAAGVAGSAAVGGAVKSVKGQLRKKKR